MVPAMSSSRMNAPISRFSCTVIDRNTFSVCGTKPMPLRARACGASAVMSSPSRRTVPARRCSSPNSAFMAVDLPAPLGPTTTAISPASTATEQPRRMSGPP